MMGTDKTKNYNNDKLKKVDSWEEVYDFINSFDKNNSKDKGLINV